MFKLTSTALSRVAQQARVRTFATTARTSDKVLAVLYDGGEAAKRQPKLLACTENELGFRKWLEDSGHELVVTSDKEGPNSTFVKELATADILITTPFHPAYLTAELIEKAPKLKYCVTAGVGSDHIDLEAANKRKLGVYEVTGSNVTSVAEHAVMTMLVLVRNFVPAHYQYTTQKGWNVADIAQNSYDIQDKVVGTVGIGRIGRLILQRLRPFGMKDMLYYDYNKLDQETETALGCRYVDSIEKLVSQCDIVTLNVPLYEGTKGIFNKELISKMKPGAWLINTARGALTVKEDIAAALESGQLNGYGGDVSYPQPAPAEYPWRTMVNTWNPKEGGGNAMTPHISGTSLDAQLRYAAGTKQILDNIWSGRPQLDKDIIVENGKYVSPAYGQHH
ncbi:formate dehydrogenase [Malassezia vespertilionis]|uniref:Formate dehydrogenase n=1 Tax=Malassezia vespertilionis TaxID=2020962 RepID=A0A2N1J8L0_9BASI|nr:formate dehydrogenase [Malassezia vespertilionis]PKI82897.1 Fdh1p [Malassezia vespertilionis]WFD08397.1 formate dehydrogenase [Malassezia vespertilionis]